MLKHSLGFSVGGQCVDICQELMAAFCSSLCTPVLFTYQAV